MFSLQLMGDIDNNFACNSVRLIQAGSQRRGHVKIRGKHFWGRIWPSCDSQITMKGLIFFFELCFHIDLGSVKKAEHRRIDVFELWCWRRLLRVPWTARRSNQCILKEINPGISFEGMMLKLKLQYFGHLMWRVDSLEDSDAGRDWGQEEKGTTEDEMAGWHHWLDGRESEWIMGVGDGQGGLACCNSWGRKESDTTEWLNWTELNWLFDLLDVTI